MPEKFLYARCRTESCGTIFEGKLTWKGSPGDVDINDDKGISPLVDLLQQHHLETGLRSMHNSYVLFINKEHALIPGTENEDTALLYKVFPYAIGFIGVTRQRNIAFQLRLDPTVGKFKTFDVTMF